MYDNSVGKTIDDPPIVPLFVYQDRNENDGKLRSVRVCSKIDEFIEYGDEYHVGVEEHQINIEYLRLRAFNAYYGYIRNQLNDIVNSDMTIEEMDVKLLELIRVIDKAVVLIDVDKLPEGK